MTRPRGLHSEDRKGPANARVATAQEGGLGGKKEAPFLSHDTSFPTALRATVGAAAPEDKQAAIAAQAAATAAVTAALPETAKQAAVVTPAEAKRALPAATTAKKAAVAAMTAALPAAG
jgi:hypothetical protein